QSPYQLSFSPSSQVHPPPPTSTLLPYTTLFRSLELDEETQALLDLRQHFLLEHLAQRPEVTITYFEPDARKEGGSYQTITIGNRDRKSTRLNSSHVSSSYAVFCLKKRNKRAHQL